MRERERESGGKAKRKVVISARRHEWESKGARRGRRKRSEVRARGAKPERMQVEVVGNAESFNEFE